MTEIPDIDATEKANENGPEKSDEGAAKKPKSKGRKVLSALGVAAVLVFTGVAAYVGLQNLALVVVGTETMGTIEESVTRRDTSDSASAPFEVTESYVFTVDGEEHRGRATRPSWNREPELEIGETRSEPIRYLASAPEVNRPASSASFSELGFFGLLRLIAAPVIWIVLVVLVVRGRFQARAKAKALATGRTPTISKDGNAGGAVVRR